MQAFISFPAATLQALSQFFCNQSDFGLCDDYNANFSE
jgi:hypothetical protein